ncbi:MAG: LbtU family siderophore porin [Pontiella sp.]|nr:LbtU family siderophore porin [Pontiella sp.]
MLKRLRFIILFSLGAACSGLAEKPVRSGGREQIPEWATNVVKSLEFGVLLEVEASLSDAAGRSESDIILATAAFDFEASFSEWLVGHVGLLWEQYDTEENNLDEAFITLHAHNEIPLYFLAGRFYLPVGNFESVFISDPLTLELAEIHKSAAMIGYDGQWMQLGAGMFNGGVKESVPIGDDGDSTIEDAYAAVSITPCEGVQFGCYWLSDLMESDAQAELGEELAQEAGYEKHGGAGAFAHIHMGPLTLNAEYVSAIGEYDLVDGRYAPDALHLEAAVQLCEKCTVGLKYENSSDLFATRSTVPLSFADKYPGEVTGLAVVYALYKNTTVSAEYLHVEDLDNNERGDAVTVQLALQI